MEDQEGLHGRGAGKGFQSVFGVKGDPKGAAKGPMKGPGAPMPGKGMPTKQKLVICQYWKENRCNRGDQCSYAHGEHELRSTQPTHPMGMKGGPPIGKGPMPPGKGGPAMGPGGVMPPPPVPQNRKTQLCVYFKEGRCTRGTGCNYAHGEHELIDRGRAAPPPAPARPMNRFDVRPPPQVPRHLRPPDRPRPDVSQRRLRKMVFARSETLEPVDRSDCAVLDPPAEETAPNEAAVNGSTPKGEDVVPDTEQAAENGEAEAEVKEDAEDAAKQGIEVDVDAEADAEKEKAAPKGAAAAPSASFLLSEEEGAQLDELYGIGAQLLRSMGWRPGGGVGANLDGELEPVSIQILGLPSTHYGRKDRRCLGRRKPKRLRDSDESSPSRTPSSSSSRSSSKSSQKSSKSSSPSSRKKKRRRRHKRKKSRSTSSRRSSPSSSSSSSKSRKKRKGKFTSEAPPNAAPGAAAAGGAGGAAATAAQQAVQEDPETAQAKKRVLAKLTELQKVEPKEQRAKEFRNMLRDWHPDKNPEKKDMATAVFQFLQKGKSLLNLK
ncbi:unnamed protein product [Effrenium voratum]|uniref:Uncharacterized protein n=1 Tax=Effrenium voratum TaxID=2562239 RepID=A0AA36JP19_9DINO|nr:unnamed protein product [Effrenium voratum]CAJ1442096.1 unnamed protein product [Effrenium voratum]